MTIAAPGSIGAGARDFPERQSMIERLLRYLALKHPWVWRVRLDLIVVGHLLLMTACFLMPSFFSADRTDVAGNNSHTVALIMAAATGGVGAYWAFAVCRGLRLREAARYGASPGPVTSALFCLSLCVWLLIAHTAPHRLMPRDPVSGLPVGDHVAEFDNHLAVTSPETYMSAEAAAVRKEIREQFPLGATRADLWRSLLLNRRVESWFADRRSSDQLAQALRDYAAVREPWKERLAVLRPWDSPNSVIEDLALRQAFMGAEELKQAVRDYVLGYGRLLRELSDFSTSTDQATINVLTSIVGADRASKLLSDFDAAIRGGLRDRPPTFGEEAWRQLDGRLMDVFMDTRPKEYSPERRYMPKSIRDEFRKRARDPWEQLKQDAAAFRGFVDSQEYRRWRAKLLISIAYSGLLDRELFEHRAFSETLAEWRRACLEPNGVSELVLARAISETFVSVVVVLVALAWGLFVAAIVRVGLVETLGAVGVLVVLSTVGVAILSAVGFADRQLKLEIHYYDPIVIGLAAVAAVALLVPAIRDVRKLRQGRWSRRFALAGIWLLAAWIPFSVWNLVGRMASEFPNGAVEAIVMLAFWIAFSLCIAAIVNVLVARISSYPRIA